MSYLPVILVALALIAIQALIGGVKMVFSAPAYMVLAIGVVTAASVSKKSARPPLVCALAALALGGWVIARALTSPVPYLARTDLLMVLAALILYFATVMEFRAPRTRFILVGVLLVFALVQVVVGAVQFQQGDDFMLLPGIMRPSYSWRASGFYICPNHLAGLIEMCGLLNLGLAFWSRCRAGVRMLAAYCALMCFGGVAITGSRGGYLSVVFGLGVFAILSLWVVWLRRRGGFWLAMAGMLAGTGLFIGGGILFMSQSATLQARLAQVYDPTNMRISIWKGALAQYHLQPLTGTGSGTTLYLARRFRAADVQNDPQHAHDDYLELLAEYGVVGAALCCIFILVHLSSGLAGLKRIVDGQIQTGAPGLSNDLALVVGAFSAIGALLFHSLLDFNMHIPGNALFVAFLFGVLATPISETPPETVAPARPAGAWRWLVVAVALCLLVLSGRFWPGEIFAEKARVALRDDRNSDALAFARRGIACEKNNPFLYSYLGEAQHFLTLSAPNPLAARTLHEDAVSAYAAGLKLFPQDTGLLLKQAQAFDLLERFPDAEADFRQMFRYDPMYGAIYAYYGLHWQLQRRMITAERCFRLAVQLGERDVAPAGLENIDRLKSDPVGRSLLAYFPDVVVDLPAERLLAKP